MQNIYLLVCELLKRHFRFNISISPPYRPLHTPFTPLSLPLHSPSSPQTYMFHLPKDRLLHPESLAFTTRKLSSRKRNIYLSQNKACPFSWNRFVRCWQTVGCGRPSRLRYLDDDGVGERRTLFVPLAMLKSWPLNICFLTFRFRILWDFNIV